MLLLLALACGPSKEQLMQEILASEEFKQMIQEQTQGKSKEMENLSEMATCLSKVSGVTSWKTTRARHIRKCGKKGIGEE